MPALKIYTTARRGIWQLTESTDELIQLADNPAYTQAIQAFHSEKRRQEWLATRLLLQQMSGYSYEIAYRPNGAPYLPDSLLHISISHTGGYVAIRLQEHPFAGIDIERKTDRILRIRNRFMHETEEASLDPAYTFEHLLLYWCAKETLFKMIGQEGVDFRQHLHVEPFPYADSGTFIVCEHKTPHHRTFTLAYQVTDDFVCVWSCLPTQSH